MNCVKCGKETKLEVHIPTDEKSVLKDTSYFASVPLCPDCIEKLKAWLKESD